MASIGDADAAREPSRALIRIVVTGSESVGKTTLATQLASRFGVACVPEFLRNFAARKGEPLDLGDAATIAEGQMALEDAGIAGARTRGDRLLLHDTDLVSTVAYCHHYYGYCPEFIEQAAIARQPTHYLLLDIDVPWVADGIRDRGEQREELQALFRETLARINAPVTVVQGTWEKRLATSTALIDSLTTTHHHD